MNKTHLVLAYVGDKPEILYLGGSREEANNIFVKNRDNKAYDAVGYSQNVRFPARSKPKHDAQIEAARKASSEANAIKHAKELAVRAEQLQGFADKAKEAAKEAEVKPKAEKAPRVEPAKKAPAKKAAK